MISRRARHAVAGAALSGCLLIAHGTATGDPAAGKRLAAARCVSCHSSTETIHSMLPLLEGQPKAAFIAQWRSFRERKRTAPVMVSLAEELSEREVNDLAEYYAALLPPRAPESSGSDIGRALADRLRCADCHGPALQGTRRRRGTARWAKGALHRLVVAADAGRHPVARHRREAGSTLGQPQQRRDRIAGRALRIAAMT